MTRTVLYQIGLVYVAEPYYVTYLSYAFTRASFNENKRFNIVKLSFQLDK